MSTELKYPIAISIDTGELVNAKDVPNGKDCNCKCLVCEEKLVAVNRELKQKAHFRHNNTDCTAKYETYLHWLCKEVFKLLDTVSLPPITIDAVLWEYDLTNEIDIIPQELKDIFNNIGNNILQKTTELKIESIETENEVKKAISTKFGNFYPDIKIYSGGETLIIEPFYSNAIDDLKKRKVKSSDFSTLSINLVDFVIYQKKHSFTIEELKLFLQKNVNSKKWIYIRKSKFEKLKSIYINKFSTFHSEFKMYSEVLNNKRALIQKINKIDKELYYLEKNIKEKYSQIFIKP
jgi:hypothetical protein